MISTPPVSQIKGAMLGAGIFFLKSWPGTRVPRLWRRTTRGYAPVTPSWLRQWLQPVAGAASHTLSVAVLDSDLSAFPPVPEAAP
jgi:hypothetical protein